MEVHFDAVPGFSVPSDCYMLLRVGSEKRHSRFAPSQSYHFPTHIDPQTCQLEFFWRLGSWQFPFDSSGQDKQQVSFQRSEAGLDVRFNVIVSNSEASKASPDRTIIRSAALPQIGPSTAQRVSSNNALSPYRSSPSHETRGLDGLLAGTSRSGFRVRSSTNVSMKSVKKTEGRNQARSVAAIDRTNASKVDDEHGGPLVGVMLAASSTELSRCERQLEIARSRVHELPVLLESAPTQLDRAIESAARWLCRARAILVGTGAGMGVDCGLGTYRGQHAGVWPPLKSLGLEYHEIANPDMLSENPQLGWAFWRYCHAAYKTAVPHEGYQIIKRWADQAPLGAFCYTSNIDALWPRVLPEENVYEVHGSTEYLQCTSARHACQKKSGVWRCPDDFHLSVCLEQGCEDKVTSGTLPRCHLCNAVARPNVLMFGDFTCAQRRLREQSARYKQWVKKVEQAGLPVVCLEIGAGRTVPTVRSALEEYAKKSHAKLIRINLEDFDLPKALEKDGRAVAVPLGALDALRRIENCLSSLWNKGHRATEGACTDLL